MKLRHKERIYQIINSYFWEVRFRVLFVFFTFCISSPNSSKWLCILIMEKKEVIFLFELGVILNQIRVL